MLSPFTSLLQENAGVWRQLSFSWRSAPTPLSLLRLEPRSHCSSTCSCGWAVRKRGGNISRNDQGCRLLAHQPPKLPHCPSPPAASASHFRPVRGCKANTGLCRGLVEPGPAWALGPEPAWPLFPFTQLHSAKRGEGFCPEGACQAPTPAVPGPTPQPCRISGPSGSHSYFLRKSMWAVNTLCTLSKPSPLLL